MPSRFERADQRRAIVRGVAGGRIMYEDYPHEITIGSWLARSGPYDTL
jgi:hypothetical protein